MGCDGMWQVPIPNPHETRTRENGYGFHAGWVQVDPNIPMGYLWRALVGRQSMLFKQATAAADSSLSVSASSQTWKWGHTGHCSFSLRHAKGAIRQILCRKNSDRWRWETYAWCEWHINEREHRNGKWEIRSGPVWFLTIKGLQPQPQPQPVLIYLHWLKTSCNRFCNLIYKVST